MTISPEPSVNQIEIAFNSAFAATKEILSRAISNGNDMIHSPTITESKKEESQTIINAAQGVHVAKNQFDSDIDRFTDQSNQRSESLHDQMAETNRSLESAYITFSELVSHNTSPRSGTAKSVLMACAPFFPVLVYYSYKKFGEAKKIANEQNQRIALEQAKRKEMNENMLIFHDPYE